MRIVEMVRNDIKKSSLLRTKILIYAFNGRTIKNIRCSAFAHGQRARLYAFLLFFGGVAVAHFALRV